MARIIKIQKNVMNMFGRMLTSRETLPKEFNHLKSEEISNRVYF